MMRIGDGVVALVDEPQLIYLPLWREAFIGIENLKVKASPVYWGFGVPRGDGAPVILIPGFLMCDAYLFEMKLWLARIGYKPYLSRIGQNADCPEVLTQRLMATVDRAIADTGRRAHLIGHSLGGVLARGAACREPDLVASVATLASPFRGVRVNPFIAHAIEFVRKRIVRRNQAIDSNCYTMMCDCDFPRTMKKPWPTHIPQTAVYTKDDGIVDWKTCVNEDAKTDVEVRGTHSGLVWNAQAYKVVAEHLAETNHRATAPKKKPQAKSGPTNGNNGHSKNTLTGRTKRRTKTAGTSAN